MKRKKTGSGRGPAKKRLKPYMVYVWIPVNVKVKASSVEMAESLALNAMTAHGLRELDTDDARPIYMDDGVPAKLDKQKPALLEADKHREYARIESEPGAGQREQLRQAGYGIIGPKK